MDKKIFKKKMIEDFRSGQVAIIVLIVSALMVTVGLSLSKKATVETKIDTNEEALKKAFNAAESGIEYYLGTGRTDYGAPDDLSSAKVTTRNIEGEGGRLDFGEYVPVNGVEYYWLVNHNTDGSLGSTYYSGPLSVCGVAFTGSLEINQFYLSGGNFGVKRYGFNFNNNVATQVNEFTNSTGMACVSITPLVSNPILVTLTPIFNGGRFYIQGGGIFPSQGVEIFSLGTAGGFSGDSNAVEINKKLRVLRRYKLPYFLLSGVVSETSVLSQ